VELLHLSAFYPIKQNLLQHSFFFEDPKTYNVETSILWNSKIMPSFVSIFLLNSTITILRLFLTLSIASLDKACSKKSNGIGFRVIGYTRCTLEQCELSFANFLLTL
jgi:hypothetical protein